MSVIIGQWPFIANNSLSPTLLPNVKQFGGPKLMASVH